MRRVAFVVTLLLLLAASSALAVTWAHAPVNVAATSTVVLAANANRLHPMILQNDSDADMYCDLTGAAAVLHQGVRLNAGGGSWTSDSGNPTKTSVACIHGSTGNKTVLITEVTGP